MRKTQEIKQIIEDLKQENGNESFTNKDLIWYLVRKTDKIDERISELKDYNQEKLNKKLSKKTFRWVIGLMITVQIAVIGGLAKIIY